MPDVCAQPAADAVDTDALRAALGQFATGVCLVTAPAPAADRTPFAITVNSFASVSLQPPMVLWCVQKSSTTYGLWRAASRFGISVLNSAQGHLCERFAIRDNHWMDQAGDYEQGPHGTPLIPGALATFECRSAAHHDAGDHTIIVADVLGFRHDNSLDPLIYHRGAIDGST